MPSVWTFLWFGFSGFRQVLLRLFNLEKLNWRKIFAQLKSALPGGKPESERLSA